MTPCRAVASTLPVAVWTPHRRPVWLALLFAVATMCLTVGPAAAAVVRRRPGMAGAATTARTPERAPPGGWSAPYGVPSSAAAIILGGADAFPSASAVRSASVAHRGASSPPVAAAADPPPAAAFGRSPTVHAVETADTCPCEVLSEGGMCIKEVGRGICIMRKCDAKWVCTAAGATMCHKRPARTALTCTVAFGGWGPNVVVCPCELLPTDRLLVEPIDRDQA